MRRKRVRRGFGLRELHTILNDVFPQSIHCYTFQYIHDGGRWTACTTTRDDGTLVGWMSEETYPDQFSALCAAYRHARHEAGRVTYRGYSPN